MSPLPQHDQRDLEPIPVRGVSGGARATEPGRKGLARYLAIARAHWVIMLAVTGLAVGLAVGAWSLTSRTYSAEAIVLVSPVSGDDPTLAGVSVLRSSSDPTRDVSTAARLIATDAVAGRAKEILGSDRSIDELLADVSAQPIAGSDLVSVTATAATPDESAAIANAFARAGVEVRTVDFQAQVTALVNRLSAQAGVGGDASLVQRLAALKVLQGAPDPTVRVVTEAAPPTSSSSPRLALVVPAALIAGLVVAFGVALLSEALLARLRREEQLFERFDVPILGRIPLVHRKTGGRPVHPDDLPPRVVEAFRTLQQNLSVLRREDDPARTILFTSSVPHEGKTSCAINTALALAEAGNRVILIDADVRRPSVAEALSLTSSRGLGAVLRGEATLGEAVLPIRTSRGSLDVLLVGPTETRQSGLLNQSAVRSLISAARARADFIVLDSSPLGTVSDALPLATNADDVIVVVRQRLTRLATLEDVNETLWRAGAGPRGFVYVGAAERQGGRGADYYEYEPEPIVKERA